MSSLLIKQLKPKVALELLRLTRFLILACDGLWKAFGNEEAIKYVHELLGKAVKISLPIRHEIFLLELPVIWIDEDYPKSRLKLTEV
ncbi:hypothetical protein ANCDUO_16610, partial [Ancylostoma duodenale]